jgi:hypothetical protein
MSFLSKVKSAAKVAVRTTAKVANAPTSVATKAISKVAPKPLAKLVRAAGNLTPQAIVARKVLSMSSARAAPRAAAAIARTPPAQTRAALKVAAVAAGAAGLARAAGPKASIARVAPMPPPPPPDPPPAPSEGDDGGAPPEYSGGDVDPYGQDQDPPSPSPDGDSDDPTVELPDGYLAPGGDDGAPGADMAGLDYHQALAGLGDWQTDLENFAKTAAENVGKQALTTIGSKLTSAGKPVVPVAPPPSMFASPVVKVALGAAALGAVYLLVSRRGSAPAAPAPAAA